MARIGVIYTESGYYRELVPTWMFVNCHDLPNDAWNKTLYIPIEASLKRWEIDDSDNTTAITVPLSAYTIHSDRPSQIGIHLPTVESFAQLRCQKSGFIFSRSNIDRFVLRVSDIEEVLQLDIRFLLIDS